MDAFQLKSASFLISQLTNDLELVKKSKPEWFQPRDVNEEDPGMNYKFRVEEQLSKNVSCPDPDQDQKLKDRAWARTRKSLPIDANKEEIQDTIQENKYTMIIGGTGSGKSTRVPQFILEDEIKRLKGSSCRIICTQPRRVAATSIAKRVAVELGEKIGDSVGYAIRGDVVPCRKEGGTLFYCTTGVLVRKLIDNPALVGISHVVIDEIHERSLELEMLIYFLKRLAVFRSNFRLIVMSATMNQETYGEYLETCPVINIPATNFPVKEYYLGEVGLFIGSAVGVVDMASDSRFFVLVKLVEHIVKNMPEGAILIFVPGWHDMDILNDRLINYNDKQTDPNHIVKIRLLYSRVALEDRKIFDPIKGPGRKVLISTTIAESSITVPDVVYVIDLGLHNVWVFDEYHKTLTIKTQHIAKASAEQRKGRAGRVAPGIVFRLYSKTQYLQFPAHLDSKKGNQNVGSVILNVLSLGETVDIFKTFVSTPNYYQVQHELSVLRRYKLIGDNDRLTLLGRRINQLSADPLIAKMLIFGGMFGCVDQVATVAAGLATPTLFPMPAGHKETKRNRKRNRGAKPPTRSELTGQLTLSKTSDGLAIMGAIRKYSESFNKAGFCTQYLLNQKSCEDVLILRDVIKGEMATIKGATQKIDTNLKSLEGILAAAFLPNLATTRYTTRTHCAKFYVNGYDGFVNAPLDSTLNNRNLESGRLFTYNDCTGIPPKLNASFLNKISAEAAFIFAEEVRVVNSSRVLVNGFLTIEGGADKVQFLHSLRAAWRNLFANHLTTPTDINWADEKGRVLEIIMRLLAE